MTKLRIGDTVEWTSQSAGIAKTKRGTVVSVLPPGKDAEEWVKDCGIARDEETYVIAVRTHSKYKMRVRYHWPVVARLKLVAAGEEAIT